MQIDGVPNWKLVRRFRHWKTCLLPPKSLRWKVFKKVAEIVLPSRRLSDGGERVTPECPNDCYVAHLSIYDWATQFTCNKKVLDAGCGAGYGSNHLLVKGRAQQVEGVDISCKAIRYCQHRFRNSRLHFRVGDILDPQSGSTKPDFVFASNVLEHVPHIEEVLHSLALRLEATGTFAHRRAARSYQRAVVG